MPDFNPLSEHVLGESRFRVSDSMKMVLQFPTPIAGVVVTDPHGYTKLQIGAITEVHRFGQTMEVDYSSSGKSVIIHYDGGCLSHTVVEGELRLALAPPLNEREDRGLMFGIGAIDIDDLPDGLRERIEQIFSENGGVRPHDFSI